MTVTKVIEPTRLAIFCAAYCGHVPLPTIVFFNDGRSGVVQPPPYLVEMMIYSLREGKG